MVEPTDGTIWGQEVVIELSLYIPGQSSCGNPLRGQYDNFQENKRQPPPRPIPSPQLGALAGGDPTRPLLRTPQHADRGLTRSSLLEFLTKNWDAQLAAGFQPLFCTLLLVREGKSLSLYASHGIWEGRHELFWISFCYHKEGLTGSRKRSGKAVTWRRGRGWGWWCIFLLLCEGGNDSGVSFKIYLVWHRKHHSTYIIRYIAGEVSGH